MKKENESNRKSCSPVLEILATILKEGETVKDIKKKD